jgi:hypothetical protein
MSLNLENGLLETLFETISNEVHVFEAVRNSDHIITDFKSLMGNKTTGVTNGKLYNKLFDRFVNVIETNEPLDMIFQDQDRWHHVRAKNSITA